MRIIKRNGKEVTFSKNNIVEAINKANQKVKLDDRFTLQEIKEIAKKIEDKCKNSTAAINVEDIQDFVETEIQLSGKFNVAKEYITFRYVRGIERKKNTTDDLILSLLKNENEEIQQENANKNPAIVSTQRDYMAGIISKDISKRFLIPSDIYKAHKEGSIHFHDMDYFAMPIYNCFGANEELITDTGVRKFCSFSKDGETTYVKDFNGDFRLATVKCYGNQECNKVTLTTRTRFEKTIIVTPNHRWLLDDGTFTTNLKIGDNLALTKDSTSYEIKTREDARAWCIGFIIGDGCDNNNYTQARLCGYKNKYLKYFEMAGFVCKDNNGDYIPKTKFFSKQDFLNGKSWRFLNPNEKSLVFKGYYSADGNRDRNSISTTDERVANMIEEISGIAGYYIMNKKETIRTTNYKENAKFINFKFLTETKQNYGWKVKNIESYQNGNKKQVWCVEEPITKTFTLANGVVTGNCCLVNLDDMLQNGTVISSTYIDKPKTFHTACNIASQIVAQVASSQYGGQTISAYHLSKFVKETRKYLTTKFKEEVPSLTEEQLNQLVEKETLRDIKNGIQTLTYEINTLQTTNGQTPFVSVSMYLNEAPEDEKDDLALVIEEILKQRIVGVKNEAGSYYANPFPKLLYVVESDNINKDGKYLYLTKLAAECTSKRMVPDYISEKVMKEQKIDKKGNGNCYPCMGCRSFLTPYIQPEHKITYSYSNDFMIGDESIESIYNRLCKDKAKVIVKETIIYNNKIIKSITKNGLKYDVEYSVKSLPKYLGRFNQGVVTMNLVDVALSSKGDLEKFWYILESRLELCHRALRLRHEHLRGVKSDVAPILWQHGAIARLKPGETIDNLLYNGYSTISLGYAGLYECVKYMTNNSHSDTDGKDFGMLVMQKLNDKCKDWKAVEKIDYSVYGTPIENTTEKFAKCLQKRFGIIKGITDRNYITNSYHIPVFEQMDAFTKLDIESEFQKLSPGGAISYIETTNLTNNVDAIISVIEHIHEHIMYAEINCKLSWCHCCGGNTVVMKKSETDKLYWQCDNCGNSDLSKLNVIRRICGYLGNSNHVAQGRMQDINERVEHLN